MLTAKAVTDFIRKTEELAEFSVDMCPTVERKFKYTRTL